MHKRGLKMNELLGKFSTWLFKSLDNQDEILVNITRYFKYI